MPRTLTFRQVRKRLTKHDRRFEFWERRGKGSHRIIYHPDIDGRPVSFPVKCHGEGTELRRGVLVAITRRFKLPRSVLLE